MGSRVRTHGSSRSPPELPILPQALFSFCIFSYFCHIDCFSLFSMEPPPTCLLCLYHREGACIVHTAPCPSGFRHWGQPAGPGKGKNKQVTFWPSAAHPGAWPQLLSAMGLSRGWCFYGMGIYVSISQMRKLRLSSSRTASQVGTDKASTGTLPDSYWDQSSFCCVIYTASQWPAMVAVVWRMEGHNGILHSV